jgi:peptide/nickel transport system permease protein
VNHFNWNKLLIRAAVFFISVFVLSVFVFWLSRLAPGDPLVSYYGDRVEKMTTEERDRAEDRLGLNQPVARQYVIWAGNALHGDFGISYKYKQQVTTVIEQRMANTLILGGIGFVLTFALSLLLGLLCARYEDSALDRFIQHLGTVTASVPEFWFSLILILIFSVTLKLLPSSGAWSVGSGGSSIIDRMVHLILPMTVLVLSHLWYYAYMIRNMLLEEIREDYVLMARAKGLTRSQILFRHCLRNIMPAFISLMAISVPHILGGTFIIETVFSYPGIGTLAYESARYHDYNLLMLICMITGVVVIFCNILGQAVAERIDPRMKDQEQTELSEVEDVN